MKEVKAVILVHPGSLIANAGTDRMEDALRDFSDHAGPKIVIDGFLSDRMHGFDRWISEALDSAALRGNPALRLWGCDAGEEPYPGWEGRGLPDQNILPIYDSQTSAARAIASLLQGYDVLLTGAWATRDESSGCINSVIDGLRDVGWMGDAEILPSSLYEDDPEFGCAP